MTKITYCLLFSIAALSGGCATLTKGSSQTVTVNTDPSGGTCTMTHDAKPVAIVNSTPGSVPVEKARGASGSVDGRSPFEVLPAPGEAAASAPG